MLLIQDAAASCSISSEEPTIIKRGCKVRGKEVTASFRKSIRRGGGGGGGGGGKGGVGR